MSDFEDRATDCPAELIAQAEWLISAGFVREEIRGIQRTIAMKFVKRSMIRVCARFRDRIDQSSGAASEFGGVRVGLNFEFLQRVNRWLHDLHVPTAKRVRVRGVVYSIKQEGVLKGTIAIHIECALELDRLQSRRG